MQYPRWNIVINWDLFWTEFESHSISGGNRGRSVAGTTPVVDNREQGSENETNEI